VRGSRGRYVAAAAAAGVVAVVAAVSISVVGGSSTRRAAATTTNAAQSLGGHRFLAPECAPVSGPRWRYPGPARITSTSYELFAIRYSCAAAESWAKKLAPVSIPVFRSGKQSELHGPTGFYCSALPDAAGHAYAGACQKGNVAFGWNWNVANSRSALVRDDSGKYHVTQLSGSDAQTIIGPLAKGRVTVEVVNTSGIGFLDGFTWAPPPGWTITAVRRTTGGTCRLEAGGAIGCRGRVPPPSCLCTSDGGTVKIELAVRAPSASDGRTFGVVGAKLRITNMTPVPYLIPGTPAEAKRQRGV
jgi:hypothetical protein